MSHEQGTKTHRQYIGTVAADTHRFKDKDNHSTSEQHSTDSRPTAYKRALGSDGFPLK